MVPPQPTRLRSPSHWKLTGEDGSHLLKVTYHNESHSHSIVVRQVCRYWPAWMVGQRSGLQPSWRWCGS